MQLRTIADLGDLRGKRVLLRADFNVPMHGRRIGDDAKIRRTIPTIAQLRDAGARIVLMTHLGHGGPRDGLGPVAAHLAKLLRVRRALLVRPRVGTPTLVRATTMLRDGDILLLGNLRSYAGEEQNASSFARQLAALGDVYVNDAFAVCHRAHASVVALPRLLPAAAGLLLEREVSVLTSVLRAPRAPFIVLMGGAKITTKLPVIEHLRTRARAVLLGGALVNHFFVARGYGVGDSFVEADGVAIAHRLLAHRYHRRCVMPIDVVVGRVSSRAHGVRVVPIGAEPRTICGPGEAIRDIGPATIRMYSTYLRTAATIVWNGPMGMCERPPFHHGSIALARVIASRSSGRAFGVVGGGETLEVLARTHMERYIDHVSTGGGAMLAFLAGEELPGLTPLEVRSQK